MSTDKGMKALHSAVGIVAAVIMMLMAMAVPAHAQAAPYGITSAMSTPSYPGFFSLANPGRFDLIAFGGGFGSNKYATVQEGFQGEQTLTRYLGLVGRITGYELWEGEGFANPLNPGGPV